MRQLRYPEQCKRETELTPTLFFDQHGVDEFSFPLYYLAEPENRDVLISLQEKIGMSDEELGEFLSSAERAESLDFVSFVDELIKLGREQNKLTKFNCDKKAETALLNRLENYKKNHLLFLYDFRVPFSNNMSEQDFRPCKNREKMAGGFRKDEGRDMYCNIMSFIQTMKRQGGSLNCYCLGGIMLS